MKLVNIHKLIFVMALGGLWSCGSGSEETRPIRKDITETIFASGELEVEGSYFLVAQVEGTLTEVRYREGNPVESGKIFALIDNQINQLAEQNAQEQYALARQNADVNGPTLKQLAAQLSAAEERLTFDSLQAVRYRRLSGSEAVAHVESERADLAYQAAQKTKKSLLEQYQSLRIQADQQVVSQRNQAQINRVVLGYSQVIIPVGGIVLQKLKEKGDYVRKGDVIARIGQPHAVYARLAVDEASIAQVKTGQTVYIKLNTHPDTVWTGRVTDVLPTFDPSRQSFIVKASWPLMSRDLLVGTQLEANIVTRNRSQVLVIPRLYLGYGQKVWKKDEAEPVTVQTGFISDQWVEIKSGVSASDVLTLPKR